MRSSISPGALGRALAEAPLELVDVGCDEDRHAAGDVVLDRERPVQLELEDADAALLGEPLDLGAQRAVAPAGDVRHPFQELVGVDAGA